MEIRKAFFIAPTADTDRRTPVRCTRLMGRAAARVACAPSSCGFTLLESLIVVAIAAILATIAVPSLRSILSSVRQNSALALVVGDLNQARGEAIKRNARVLMCVRNPDGTQCGTSTNWQAGWVICVAGAITDQCSDFNPMTVRPPLDPTLTLNASAAAIRFNANSSQGVDGTAATLTVSGTGSSPTTRTVSVAGTGNISKQ